MMHRRFFFLLAVLLQVVACSHADDGIHWSLQKPVRPRIPELTSLRQAARARNQIDRFVLQQLQVEGLESAPVASRATLVRRAYFDLLGLPPSHEQVDTFLSDQSPNAWPRLIDTLLKSKHYGERWGRHWLDVVRYADSGGYETDIYYRNAWKYRDYVVRSFNDDKPFNTFVQEQIAGDELWPDNLDLDPRRVYVVPEDKQRHFEARVGTGLYSLGPRVHESALDGNRLAYETLTDWADTTASAFMGLTLACARCHDHKFDAFEQKDYFALQAIFATAREMEVPTWNAMGEADWRQSYPRLLAVQEARRAYRLFEATGAGRQLKPEEQARRQELLAAIGQAVLNLPERTGGPLGTIPYDAVMQIPMVNVLGREHPDLIRPIHRLERGELSKPRERVDPALPQVLAEATNISALFAEPLEARKKFALWLTRDDHPLTARVIVNRIWHWHFGRGIVETPNDFGVMGQPPSHPELLDWLTTEFVAKGWKIKDLHRLIMNSAAYRQTSQFANDACLSEDPGNRLLWRMNRRRLEAEALWDAVHAVSGTINLKLGGPPVVPPLAEDEIASLREKWHWVVSADPAEHTRRGLYILTRRNFRFPMFEVFDTPVNSQSCPVRDVTTVAPQALWGLNNRSVFQQAVEFAGRVVRETGNDGKQQIDRIWQIALSRAPEPYEAESAMRLLKRLENESSGPLQTLPESLKSLPPARAQALAQLCLALFNVSEFSFVD